MTRQSLKSHEALDLIFSGKKAKWLALYRRFAARMLRISALNPLEMIPGKGEIALGRIGRIKVTPKGLELSLALPKAVLRSNRLKPASAKSSRRFTHRVLISDPDEIDEEIFVWLKAAQGQSRQAR